MTRSNTLQGAFGGLFGLGAILLLAPRTTHATMPLLTPKGCFSSAGSLSNQGTYQYQSTGYCQQQCFNQGASVMGVTQGSQCWCGNSIPPKSDAVEQSECSTPCNGYGQQSCGGDDAFGIFLTGTSEDVPQDGGSSGSSSAQSFAPVVSSSYPSSTQQYSDTPMSSSSSVTPVVTTIQPSPEVVTVRGSTVVSTVPGTVATSMPPPASSAATLAPAQQGASSSGGTSTAGKVGIAVGVIVGLVVLAAVIGGFIVYFKKRNGSSSFSSSRHNRNNASVNGFVTQGAAPAGSAASISDSRLDPGMVETRRNSAGSIMGDDQDYSRRILKVTNPSRDSRMGQ